MSLKLENVTFAFNSSKKILENVSLTLEQGSIYALMGVNGAGKSTLFNILTGFLKMQTGSVFLNDVKIDRLPPYKRSRIGITRTFQDLRLIGSLTVNQNIALAFRNKLSDKWYNALLPKKSVKQQDEQFQKRTIEILDQFHLTEVQENLANEISYGQQKLLNIACCVANESQVILLDEPVAGVNPIYREQLAEILINLKHQGKIILLVEHNTEFVNQVADKIFFLSNLRIREYVNLEEMKQDREVINAYL